VPRAIAYADASAFVKLIVDEPETEALVAALDGWPIASSALLEVEATLAVRRRDPAEIRTVHELLRGVELIEVDAGIRRAAGDLSDAPLRTLDAIHLATALSLGDRCGTLFAYDDRLIAAARAHGLSVTVPRP
jgi:predicted nucleic acid-binding protein